MATQIARSYAAAVDPQISPADPLQDQKKKNKKQKKMRGAPKMNLMMMEAEKPLVVTLADEKLFDSAQVLIKQTRRCNYIVFLPVFLGAAKSALRDGTFTISQNLSYNVNSRGIQLQKKRSGNMTIHAKRWQLIVKMDLVYGPSQSQIKRLVPVDIWGAQINAKGDLAINADPEVMVWAERAINLHAKTHYPCIKHNCYMTFDCQLHYDMKYVCIACNTPQCPKCQASWEVHQGFSCAQYKLKQEADKVSDECVMKLLYDGDMQACPKCNTLTQKSEGCNKMICEVKGCGEFWCWGCGVGRLREDPRNHGDPYNHWHGKLCPVFNGVFSEDVASQKVIKDAIRDRNVRIFGDKIRTKPKEEPKPKEDLDDRKEPLTTPLPRLPRRMEAPGAPRRMLAARRPLHTADIPVEDPQFVENPNDDHKFDNNNLPDLEEVFPMPVLNRQRADGSLGPVNQFDNKNFDNKNFDKEFPGEFINRLPARRPLFPDERKEFEHKENVAGAPAGPPAQVAPNQAPKDIIADMAASDAEIADYLTAREMQMDADYALARRMQDDDF